MSCSPEMFGSWWAVAAILIHLLSLFSMLPKLQETVTCSFFVKDQQKMFDLFGGFFQIFNQDEKNSPSSDLPLQVLGVEKGCKKKHEHHDPTTAAKAAQRLIQKIQQLSRPAETTISKHIEKNKLRNT